MKVSDGDRRFRPAVIAVAALGVALLVAAVVAEAVFHVSIDPTESTFAVTLHNDTANAVLLKQCDADCGSFHERDRLPPGASVRVNTSSDDVANWWAVTDAGGKTSGCLPLRYDHKVDGLVVNVSEQTACPTGGSAGSGVVGSIVGFALVVVVVGIGVASIVFATTAAHRLLQRRGFAGGTTTALTTLAAFVIFLGGWLLFDLYVVLREGSRVLRRPAPAT